MNDVPDNPYSAPEMGPFDSKLGTFSLRGDGILCGSVLKLPQICLQTGETNDIHEVRSFVQAASPWLWKSHLAAGLVGDLTVAASMTLFQFAVELSKSPIWFYSIVLALGIVALFALVRSLLTQSVSIRGYIARKQRRPMGTAALLMLATGLPFWVLMLGTMLGYWFSIKALMFADSWMPLTLVVGAVISVRFLRRLLEWHWRNTRQRGLVFHAEQVSDGVFLVTGFSSEFLAALRKLPQHFQHGWTAEEILRQHPDLRPEQVYSALTWFYDNYVVVADLHASLERSEQQRSLQQLSRDELLRRRLSAGT